MISSFDSADVAIDKAINDMCQELLRTPASHEDFLPLVEAISKLRASLNPIVCQPEQK